jgi:hypothetical protein
LSRDAENCGVLYNSVSAEDLKVLIPAVQIGSLVCEERLAFHTTKRTLDVMSLPNTVSRASYKSL